jgi:hypothetical protein
MKKSNISGTGDKRNVNPNWFTGKTWMKVLSEKIKAKDQDIYHVHFTMFILKKDQELNFINIMGIKC